jgi:16S rRNA (cytosine967-C5)-methyltransferase
MSDGLLTRQIAYDLLNQILGQKKPMDQVFSHYKGFNGLESRDINFVRMLVATCLRRKGQLDQVIEYCQDKPKPLSPKNIYIVLYIGLCQILFMDVTDHAAVNTTVELAKKQNMERQKGFINAVLRRVIREKEKIYFDEISNIPDWLMSVWEKDYGRETAKEIALYSLKEAPTDITIKDSDTAEWLERLGGVVLKTESLRLSSGGVTELEGFREGAWWVQDASAALPVKLMGDLTDKNIIDLCAAPGGKTMQLAAKGANVIAVDRSEKRLERLHENLKRCGLDKNVRVEMADGATWQPDEKADIVLLDVPCSATGTIRRHPDLMYLKTPKDIESLKDIQKRLLLNAAQMLKPEGVLLYCTCSLQKEEGEEQVAQFLEENPKFERIPIKTEEIGGVSELINADGELRILPHYLKECGGMDGFFVARLIKT